MTKWFSLVLICLVMCLTTLPALGGSNHVDISLRGPWILYVDKTFAGRPVLIAMAPAVNSSMKMSEHNPWRHKPPTVSAGDAYTLMDYTQNPPPNQSHIYCLTFESVCAREGPPALTFDDYPSDTKPLNAKPTGANGEWDWIGASRNNSNAPTLILPMPDSYSSDGVWNMRFAANYKGHYINAGLHSIGVQLHYKSGPKYFELLACEEKQPTLENCTKPANIHDHTKLTNSGTLRIELKAPETDWACDPHVRRIYPEMMKLVNTPEDTHGLNNDMKVIDPAVDYLGQYSAYCLAHDHQGGKNDDPPRTAKGKSKTQASEFTDSDLEWFADVHALVKDIDGLKLSDTQSDYYYFNQIAEEGRDLSFPKLSQIRRIEVLLAQSEIRLAAYEARGALKSADVAGANAPKLDAELALIKDALILKPPTKGGGDCLAAIILIEK